MKTDVRNTEEARQRGSLANTGAMDTNADVEAIMKKLSRELPRSDAGVLLALPARAACCLRAYLRSLSRLAGRSDVGRCLATRCSKSGWNGTGACGRMEQQHLLRVCVGLEEKSHIDWPLESSSEIRMQLHFTCANRNVI